ncbi:AAA family ATPase [Nocardia sp. IFM 10818]
MRGDSASPDAGGLTVLIGPSGAGKSTWAHERFTSTSIVSLDALRAAVCDDEADQEATYDAVLLADLLVRFRLSRSLPTVVDATNLEYRVRRSLLAVAARYGVPVHAVLFDVPLRTCLAGQGERPRSVPERVVTAQHAATTDLLANLCVLVREGFSSVTVVVANPVPADEPGAPSASNSG